VIVTEPLRAPASLRMICFLNFKPAVFNLRRLCASGVAVASVPGITTIKTLPIVEIL
jgi:hypothetical protein